MLTLRQVSVKSVGQSKHPILGGLFEHTVVHNSDWLLGTSIVGGVSCATHTVSFYFCDSSVIKDSQRNSNGDFGPVVVEENQT